MAVRFKKMTKVRAFTQGPILRLLIICFLFVTAFCLRLYQINQLPMDFYPVRQYHSALLARGFYEWLLIGELTTFPQDGILEPPILELIASCAYYIFGGEYLWIPRLLSAGFWMVGGIFLYLIAKRITTPNAAVFSVFFYLFVPYSVFASRAFMPDPLMVMLLLIGIFTMLRYHEHPTTHRMLIAAIVSSLAVFAKPIMSFFQIFTTFVSLAVYRRGFQQATISIHFLVFIMLSILPTSLYYLYGTFISGFLQAQVSDRIVPQVLLQEFFWQGWSKQTGLVVGNVALVVALFGVLLVRKGLPRALLVGLWSGYLLFGLTFTFHIHTHDYYSLLLIPVVALSLGPVASTVAKQLSRAVTEGSLGRVRLRYYGVGVGALALVILASALSAVEHGPTIRKIVHQKHDVSEYARKVATYEEIGEAVNHSRRTIILASDGLDFGYPLMYHGDIYGDLLPLPIQMQMERWRGMREITPEEHFNTLYSEQSPEYFIMAKKHWERKEYEGLTNLLRENFTMTAQEGDYIIFDLRSKN